MTSWIRRPWGGRIERCLPYALLALSAVFSLANSGHDPLRALGLTGS